MTCVHHLLLLPLSPCVVSILFCRTSHPALDWRHGIHWVLRAHWNCLAILYLFFLWALSKRHFDTALHQGSVSGRTLTTLSRLPCILQNRGAASVLAARPCISQARIVGYDYAYIPKHGINHNSTLPSAMVFSQALYLKTVPAPLPMYRTASSDNLKSISNELNSKGTNLERRSTTQPKITAHRTRHTNASDRKGGRSAQEKQKKK
jgi:hypothetical protein